MIDSITLSELKWLLPFLRASIILIVGYYLATYLAKKSESLTSDTTSLQYRMLIKKTIYFSILLLFIVASLQQLHFKLSVLLGSAGIVTLAVGFAAKTSLSNIICGVFLILEKSFVVGDTIKVKGHQGEIMSIDLLSVKIRTADNTMVRVPNEEILGTDVINLTHFRQRRLDISVAIRYEADLAAVQKLLLDTANESQFNAKKPSPSVSIDQFTESAIKLKLSIWVNKSDYAEAKNTLQQSIKLAFDQNKIETPYPQMKVQIVEANKLTSQ